MNETFEDRFYHNSDKPMEEDYDIDDLGPDEEFSKPIDDVTPEKAKKEPAPKVNNFGCFWGLFKAFLSFALLWGAYIYLVNPEKVAGIEEKVKTFISLKMSQSKQQATTTEQTKTKETVAKLPKVDVSYIQLKGAEHLPDFSVMAKRHPSLNRFLETAVLMKIEHLDFYHQMIDKLIYSWASTNSKQKIEQLTNMSYDAFHTKTSMSLLSQTVFKNIGLTPALPPKLIQQPPIQAMAVLYQPLRVAIAHKQNDKEKLQTIEPITTFFVNRCEKDYECLASLDLFIDMLGVRNYTDILEHSPKSLYNE